jgi:hypothetical protein
VIRHSAYFTPVRLTCSPGLCAAAQDRAGAFQKRRAMLRPPCAATYGGIPELPVTRLNYDSRHDHEWLAPGGSNDRHQRHAVRAPSVPP